MGKKCNGQDGRPRKTPKSKPGRLPRQRRGQCPSQPPPARCTLCPTEIRRGKYCRRCQHVASAAHRNHTGVFPVVWLQALLLLKCSCWACARSQEFDGRPIKLCIDHCPQTGLVHGVLCDNCNRASGHFRHNVGLLAAVCRYLTYPPVAPGEIVYSETNGRAIRHALAQVDPHCAVCRTALPGGRGGKVDHAHETGWVRGLTCNACNLGIGCLSDDPQRCQLLASYQRGCAQIAANSANALSPPPRSTRADGYCGAVGVLDGLEEFMRANWTLPFSFDNPRLLCVPLQAPQNLQQFATEILRQHGLTIGTGAGADEYA